MKRKFRGALEGERYLEGPQQKASYFLGGRQRNDLSAGRSMITALVMMVEWGYGTRSAQRSLEGPEP